MIAILTNSCTQKINITGKPHTKIYNRSMQKIGEIPSNGTLQVILDKDCVNDIFISQEKDDDLYIPFALNFTKRNDYEIGATIGYILCVPTIMASTALIVNRTVQSEYHFKYLPEQQTNQDIVFTLLKQTADYKTLDKSPQKVSQQKTNTERRKFNSGTSQSNKDTMFVITGTYSGSGELLDGSDIIEKYDNLNIIVKKKDENTVSVSVLDFDGYSFFDEELVYSVTKQDNQYVLKQKGANSRIVIKNGILSYTNHSINDGDMIYTLKINANK